MLANAGLPKPLGRESPVVSGLSPPRLGGGASKISRIQAGHLYVDMPPVGAKKQQGSGRSPEILMVHWPFGLKFQAYKPSC